MKKDRPSVQPESVPGTDHRLATVRVFVEALDQSGISYCHWKSNEHVLAAVMGETDLDVLFAPGSEQAVTQALTAIGFLRCTTSPLKSYASIIDYVAIDGETGTIVHVHAHFGLVLGEKGIKSFILPWSGAMLGARRWDAAARIWCTSEAHEMVLLLVRCAIKVASGTMPSREWKDAQAEFAWLRQRVTAEAVDAALVQCELQAVRSSVPEILANGLDEASTKSLFRQIRPYVERHRRFGRLEAFALRMMRKSALRLSTSVLRVFPLAMPRKRTLPRQGIAIALFGPDGAGKSTQLQRVKRALEYKFDVVPVYMGSGNGPRSLLRWLVESMLDRLRDLRAVVARPSRSSGKPSRVERHSLEAERPRKGLAGALVRCRELTLALERRGKLALVHRAKDAGYMVVCDRYPQVQQFGYNDGPRLQGAAATQGAILARLARWELAVYRTAQDAPPDVVIKLVADPAILHRRRPEMTLTEIALKQDGIRALRFPGAPVVVEVDAAQSEAAVTQEILRHIATVYSHRSRQSAA